MSIRVRICELAIPQLVGLLVCIFQHVLNDILQLVSSSSGDFHTSRNRGLILIELGVGAGVWGVLKTLTGVVV